MRNRRFSGLAGAALLVLTACSDGAPTSPTEPTTSPLVGEWHGTMSYTGGECGSEEVSASASRQGSDVRLEVLSRCYGYVVLHLDDSSQALRGDASVRYQRSCTTFLGPVTSPTLKANVSGTGDRGRLHLETTEFSMYTGLATPCSRPPMTLDLVR